MNSMQISDLIIIDKEEVKLEELQLELSDRKSLLGLLRERSHLDQLHRYGLPATSKLLLHGSSGCGKTATAKAIAAALGKKLMILNLSNVISARIGETAQHLKLVFDQASREKCVLLLEEFDQIAKLRSIEDSDVGEMRRLVNSLIQLMDYFDDRALLICATNHIAFIDPAILRRFQLKIGYRLPMPLVLDDYYEKLLSAYPEQFRSIGRRYGISFAEARDHVLYRVKALIIEQIENDLICEQKNN